MWHGILASESFMAYLTQVDGQIGALVRSSGCRHCAGALHRADYPRKPRGGGLADVDGWCVRISFCCSREGCRKRATPPSVRFLGARIYGGLVVLLAVTSSGCTGSLDTSVPRRTLRRWRSWWCEQFPATFAFRDLLAHFPGGLVAHKLPGSLLAAIPGTSSDRLETALRLIAPITTSSMRNGAGFSMAW